MSTAVLNIESVFLLTKTRNSQKTRVINNKLLDSLLKHKITSIILYSFMSQRSDRLSIHNDDKIDLLLI